MRLGNRREKWRQRSSLVGWVSERKGGIEGQKVGCPCTAHPLSEEHYPPVFMIQPREIPALHLARHQCILMLGSSLHMTRRHLKRFSGIPGKRRAGVGMKWSQGQGLWDPSLEITAQMPTVSRI